MFFINSSLLSLFAGEEYLAKGKKIKFEYFTKEYATKVFAAEGVLHQQLFAQLICR